MYDVRDPCRLAAPASFVPAPPPGAGFADLVRMARRACGTPMALLSLAGGDRLRFEAGAGVEPGRFEPGSSLDGLLGRMPDGPGLLVIPDLTTDARTRADPLVVAGPALRFYAGAAMETESGERLGTLCVLDHAPRPGGLGPEEAEDLAALARLAVSQLDLPRSRAARDRLLTQRAAVAGVLTALLEVGDRRAILDLLVAAALAAVPEAEGGGVAMREGPDLVYRSGAGTLAGQVGLHRPIAGSLAGAALTGDTALLSPDLAADPRATQDLVPVPGMRAALYAPVRLGGAALGILELRAARAGAFTQDDLGVAG
jgi:GAF domain-containing protein